MTFHRDFGEASKSTSLLLLLYKKVFRFRLNQGRGTGDEVP